MQLNKWHLSSRQKFLLLATQAIVGEDDIEKELEISSTKFPGWHPARNSSKEAWQNSNF